MNSNENKNAQISALADSELDIAEVKRQLSHMDDAARVTWGLYHHIGDLLRSETSVAIVSEDFSARFAERFRAEPPLLAPQRTLVSRFHVWPTALAAVAATGFGFLVAPTLFQPHESPTSVAPSVTASVLPAEKTLLADAQRGTVSIDAQADYIRMHHAAYSPTYGVVPVSRSPSTGKQAEQ